MLCGLTIGIVRVASLGRDAQNERDRAGLCSSVTAATPAVPSMFDQIDFRRAGS